MSGFAGIIELGGGKPDRTVLETMLERAARHGPDGRNVKVTDMAGFGCTGPVVASAAAPGLQPFSPDGVSWVLGDVRLDARAELVEALLAHGCAAELARPDIELTLLAFRAWGPACVDRLLGDFAFAVWNGESRQLFCARDSLGIKPFYYAQQGDRFAFANDLAALRALPGLPSELDEQALGDFLCFGFYLDEEATIYRHIRRLQRSHTLSLEAGGRLLQQPYQCLDFQTTVKLDNEGEYAERYLDLLRQAVADRMSAGPVVFELSGGMDSTSVAAMAAAGDAHPERFLAITTDNSWQDPNDREAELAALVCRQYGIRHELIKAGHDKDFLAHCSTAQPYSWPFAATNLRFAEVARAHGRVLLTGQGGDPAQSGSGIHLLDVRRERSPVAFLLETLRQAVRRRSLQGLGLRAMRDPDTPRIRMPALPVWLRPERVRIAGSAERWHELFDAPGRYPPGCRCELAFDELRYPIWSFHFEAYYQDLFCGLDCRHPLFDLRLVNFLLAAPLMSKADKQIPRQAMRERLPEAVRTREKTPVLSDPVQAALARKGRVESLGLDAPEMARWVAPEGYRAALRGYVEGAAENRFSIMNPLALQCWLQAQSML